MMKIQIETRKHFLVFGRLDRDSVVDVDGSLDMSSAACSTPPIDAPTPMVVYPDTVGYRIVRSPDFDGDGLTDY